MPTSLIWLPVNKLSSLTPSPQVRGGAHYRDLLRGGAHYRALLRVTVLCTNGDWIVEGSPKINRLVSHPTLPVAISAHENRSIKFYDSSSGQLIHSMVAHLDSVTSLAVDPNGLYLLSGSKYRLKLVSDLRLCLYHYHC